MKKNNLIKLLESINYIMPTDEKSVENFEKKFVKEIKDVNPLDWDNPLAILERGLINKIKLVEDINSYEGMAQAARQGNQLSDEMKRKMLNDRKNSND